MALLLLAIAPSALAAKTTVKTLGNTAGGTTGGLFTTPRGIAVNKTGNGGVPAGTFYVVDTGNHRVQRFGPTGSFVSAWGWGVATGAAEYEICTVAASCQIGSSGNNAGQLNSPQGIAVDQANGNVYVSDQTQRRINVFSSTGAFEGAFGWGAVDGSEALQFCTTLSTCHAPAQTALAVGNVPGGQFGTLMGGLAVDSSGNVYFANKTSRRVDVFTPTLSGSTVTGVSFLRAFGWGALDGTEAFQVCNAPSVCNAPATAAGTGAGQFGTSSPNELAFDSTGKLYVLDAANKRVQKFDLTTTPTAPAPIVSPTFDSSAAITAAFGTGALYGLALDQANNHLYVSGSNSASVPANQIRVAEMDSTGAAVAGGIHGTDLTALVATNGLAVTPDSLGGNIFLSSNNSTQSVFVLNYPPAATLDDITVKTGITATFSGTVDPNLGSPVTCAFQYSTDDVTWTEVPVPGCPSLIAGGGPQAVSANVTGLATGTFYHVRLVVTKPFGAGSATTPEKTFTTNGPPLVSAGEASGVSDTTATLSAKVNPQNQPTTWRFEYTDDADFQANGFANATKSPEPDASAGSGGAELTVFRTISGLKAATTYHFRVVATNETAVAEGSGGTFTTYSSMPSFDEACSNEALRAGPSARLPDCRAYEQVSPVDKNGEDITGDANAVQASSNGDAVTFEVSGGIPGGGGEGGQEVPLYLARRGGTGSAAAWSGQGLLPPAGYGSSSKFSGWTPDLSQSFTTTSIHSGEPALLSRSSADSSIAKVSDYTPAGGGMLDGASADGSKVFFENNQAQLAPGAVAGKDNLYLWDRDKPAGQQLSLAGVLPDSACLSPPCIPSGGSFSGAYSWFAGTDAATLSSGGANVNDGALRKIGMYTQDEHAVSASGNSTYFTAGGTGQLYLRQGLGGPSPTTVQVNASERSTPDPAGSAPAAFMDATPDGSTAFFTSTEKLTNDASTGPAAPPSVISRATLGSSGLEEIETGFLAEHALGEAVDGSHIYWANPALGGIGRAKLNGSGAATEIDESFIPVSVGKARWVAVDSEYVYWTNAGAKEGAGEGTIGRAKLDGSAPPEPEFIKGASQPQGIVVNGSNIYWANDGTNAIARANINGTSPEPSWHPLGGGELPQGIALSETESNLYWTTNNPNGFVSYAKLDGSGEHFAFIGSASKLRGIAVDAGHVYWVSQGEHAIGRANLDLTGIEKEFTSSIEEKTTGLAIGASSIYWSANGEGEPNPGNDLYRFEANMPEGERLTDLTVDNNSSDVCPGKSIVCGAQVQGVLGASDDGSYVYFAANGVLAANEGAQGSHAALGNCTGSAGQNSSSFTGKCNLYVWHEDPATHSTSTTFIARLDADNNGFSSDAADWEPFPSNIATENTARVSAGGKVLLFRSQNQLTAYDNTATVATSGTHSSCGNGSPGQLCPEFYRYQAGEGLTCASCNPTGAPPIGAPALQGIKAFQLHAESGISLLTRNLSASGDRVFFETPDRLVAADTNGNGGCPVVTVGVGGYRSCLDVYEWEADGSGSCHSAAQNGGCIYLLSSGTGPASFFADADEEGKNVFIFSRDRLVPQDGDQLQDLYDASEEGGLASQQSTASPGCSGDGCRGPVVPPPVQREAGTAAFSGPGNPPVKRARGKKRNHSKRHHGRHAKRAGRNRGGRK